MSDAERLERMKERVIAARAELAKANARLDRVKELADEWDKPYGEFMGHPDDVAALRAALNEGNIP